MKSLLIIGSIFAAFSVLLGAFGAHGLKNRLSVEDLVIFETAVRYQMYHAIGITTMETIIKQNVAWNIPSSGISSIITFSYELTRKKTIKGITSQINFM